MADDELTIDELARRVGMTVRNVRAHHSRGLLPPPEVRGRTGYYGPDHVARLELVQELQSEGFNLELIRRLLQNAGGSSSAVLRFKHALSEPFSDEEPESVDLLTLAERWGTTDLALLKRAEQLGLIAVGDDGQVQVRSPLLLRAGQALRDLGVSLEHALDLLEGVRENADRIAEAYVDLFVRAVWSPFHEAEQPEDRWPDVQGALERLRPLAQDTTHAIFGLAMNDAVERAFGRELARMAERSDERRAS
jgi:DNA-binding transcriptional MerR regulator